MVSLYIPVTKIRVPVKPVTRAGAQQWVSLSRESLYLARKPRPYLSLSTLSGLTRVCPLFPRSIESSIVLHTVDRES